MIPTATHQAATREILQRLHEYCWGYDANDMELLGSVFASQTLSGGKVADSPFSWGPWNDRVEIVQALGEIRASQSDHRRHVIDSVIFDEFSELKARARAYVSIYSTNQSEPPHLVTVGEYSLTAQNTNTGWKLTRLEEVLDAPF